MIARSLGINLSERTKWTGNAILGDRMIRYPEPGRDADAEDYHEVPHVPHSKTGLGNWTEQLDWHSVSR
ncbi:MAG: hypothetical protein MUD03_08890 [Pirellula sp.]|nr:hypothetical protein [Pirellula sp.]